MVVLRFFERSNVVMQLYAVVVSEAKVMDRANHMKAK